jgi:hypothetical protein
MLMDHRAILRRSRVIATALALSLGSVATAHAAGVEPAKATPAQRDQAQAHFLKGRDLYNTQKYDAALAELTASLDVVASPNTRLYVARCLRDMGRPVAAYAELERTTAEAKANAGDDNRYEKAAQAADEERSALSTKLGFVELHVNHAATETVVKVANEPVKRAAWEQPVVVAPGSVEVTVETPGRPPMKQQVEVAAGQHQAVTFDAAADGSAVAAATPPVDSDDGSTRPTLRPYFYATAGLAVVGLTTFIVAGSMANGTYSKLHDACGSNPCPPGHESDISSGKTQQTFANVGLAVFVVSAAASVTLFFVGSPKKSAPAAASARVTAGPSFVGLQGAF